MATIPHGVPHGWPPPSLLRRLLPPALILAAVACMAFAAFWPIFGALPGRGAQALTLLTIAVTLGAGFASPRGSRSAFHLLWISLGMAAALGVIGIFSAGFVFLIAAVLLVLAIAATPNRSAIELRYDRRYVMGFHAGFLGFFLAVLI